MPHTTGDPYATWVYTTDSSATCVGETATSGDTYIWSTWDATTSGIADTPTWHYIPSVIYVEDLSSEPQAEPLPVPSAMDIEAERERQRQEEAEREQALGAAERLLKGYVGEKAHQEAKENGYYEVKSVMVLGRTYLVHGSGHGNIKVMQDGELVDTLCVHPDLAFPADDIVLTKLLMLKNSEERLLEVANRHAGANW